jgi:signal transduction histidine kinase
VVVREFEPQSKVKNALLMKPQRTPFTFVSGLLTLIANIVDRKRSMEVLRREAAYLEATFENMSEAIAMVDADLKMAAWNQKFVDLFRLPPSLIRPGVPFEDIVRFGAKLGEFGTDGDIDALVHARIESVRRLEPRQFERRRPDGTVIEVRDRPLPGGGFVALYIDVTDRKRAEEARLDAMRRERRAEQRFIEAIESSSEGVVVYDDQDRFVVANSRYLEFYPDLADVHRPGVKYEDVLRASVERGQSCQLPAGMDKEAFVQDRLASFRNPGEPIIRRMAGDRWMQFSETRTPSGGLISVQTDITALKHREGELIDSKDAAEAASRAKSAFLANISHELRTPLHAVLGLAEIMRDNPDEAAALDTYRGYAKLIHESGSHLLSLINDVLDMSKIEAGRYDLAEEKLSLASIVDSCIAIVARKAREERISIVNRLDGASPSVQADMRAVKQIVLNLLSNAVKFSRAGGTVVISAVRSDSGGVTLSVADTGIGIAAEHLPRIAEPFWQGDDSHTRRYEGTGLGLAISKRLMELHGGTIQVRSTKDVGTTVEIWFPPARAAA